VEISLREFSDISASSDPLLVARMAARNDRFLESLNELLAAAQEDVLRLKLPCRACGACCDFTAMDHRLFVSGGELALLAKVRPPRRPERLRCGYQQNNLCTARNRRPLGCRMFYCESEAREPVQNLYETWHKRIITLHQEAEIPYVYGEMTAWLERVWVESEPET
jgi:Fe-S-cluster containining protein